MCEQKNGEKKDLLALAVMQITSYPLVLFYSFSSGVKLCLAKAKNLTLNKEL